MVIKGYAAGSFTPLAGTAGARSRSAAETERRDRVDERLPDERPDPEELPPTFPVMTASAVIGIGRNQTYRMIKDGTYPVRILPINGRYKVSRYDLLAYLGAARVAS